MSAFDCSYGQKQSECWIKKCFLGKLLIRAEEISVEENTKGTFAVKTCSLCSSAQALTTTHSMLDSNQRTKKGSSSLDAGVCAWQRSANQGNDIHFEV